MEEGSGGILPEFLVDINNLFESGGIIPVGVWVINVLAVFIVVGLGTNPGGIADDKLPPVKFCVVELNPPDCINPFSLFPVDPYC